MPLKALKFLAKLPSPSNVYNALLALNDPFTKVLQKVQGLITQRGVKYAITSSVASGALFPNTVVFHVSNGFGGVWTAGDNYRFRASGVIGSCSSGDTISFLAMAGNSSVTVGVTCNLSESSIPFEFDADITITGASSALASAILQVGGSTLQASVASATLFLTNQYLEIDCGFNTTGQTMTIYNASVTYT